MTDRKHISRWMALITLLFSTYVKGQDFGNHPDTTSSGLETSVPPPEPSFMDRLYFGGSAGAQFGSSTFILVSPLVGYKITDDWSVGTRVTYQYISVKYPTLDFRTHVAGASVFTRYFVYQDLFAHVEYEILNGDWANTGKRTNIPTLFVGGGYLFRFGDNAGVNLMILFNLLPRYYSPYNNPIINGGFTVGL